MRRPIIAGNWKMHKTITEAAALARSVVAAAGPEGPEVVVCPPFTALAAVAGATAGSGVAVGGQDMFWEDQGAFTGEVSAPMLLDAGCRYVIIGHSERRQFFGETDASVNKKLKAALAHKLVPIVCVGETLTEREAGATEEVVGRQVREGLAGIAPEEAAGIVIAYEPVWAIGTGRTASPADAQAVCFYIRKLAAEMFGGKAAAALRIQYGGSVKPDNIADLMAQPDIDGALVGGASLDAAAFSKIINYQAG